METLILSVTSDLELQAAQTVKIIFTTILVLAGGFNLYKMTKTKQAWKRMMRLAFSIGLFLLVIPLIRLIHLEGSLLSNAQYTNGTTLGYCQEFMKGIAIEFEYKVENKTYQNCNTFHPVAKDVIQVPGGKYLVRYAENYPEKGRMMFKNAK